MQKNDDQRAEQSQTESAEVPDQDSEPTLNAPEEQRPDGPTAAKGDAEEAG
jgi:hypothetical protein